MEWQQNGSSAAAGLAAKHKWKNKLGASKFRLDAEADPAAELVIQFMAGITPAIAAITLATPLAAITPAIAAILAISLAAITPLAALAAITPMATLAATLAAITPIATLAAITQIAIPVWRHLHKFQLHGKASFATHLLYP